MSVLGKDDAVLTQPETVPHSLKTTASGRTRDASEPGGVPLPPQDSSATRKKRPRKLRTQSSGHKEERLTIGAEVEALKTKVSQIEAQLEKILREPAGPAGPTKSARRRARHARAQLAREESDVQNEVALVPADGAPQELDGELHRLRGELSQKQEELQSLREREREAADAETDVEEIQRVQGPRLESQARPLGRSVTLSGSYRLPIPDGVSKDDVDAIGRGIRSAQSIARSFLEARNARAQQELNRPRETEGKTWSEWFGGYSVSVARALDGVGVAPTDGGDDASVTGKKRPAKLQRRGRPSARDGGGRTLSDTQVAGLLA